MGTNFIAKQESADPLNQMDQEKVNRNWIDMKMNFPAVSHMDGRWEQHMRTVRNILSVLLQESGTQLDHESFGTLMKEVQAS